MKGGCRGIQQDKRYYIENGGDITKLQTALKEVNSEIKNTQSELREENLNRYGRLDKIKETIDFDKTKTSLENMEYMRVLTIR